MTHPTTSWKGKTVIDATNAQVPPEELDGLLSFSLVAKAFTGAKFVKGLNHLLAADLANDSVVEGGPPSRLSVERRRGRDRSRGGLGPTTRVRTRQVGKAQRGWRAGTRTRPNLGPAHLPGFVQEGAVIDPRPCSRRREPVARANVFEQRATEYLKATKSRRWGQPDGVWAPFEERGDARQSRRSPGIYRLLSMAQDSLDVLLSDTTPRVLHGYSTGTPPHSHSIV